MGSDRRINADEDADPSGDPPLTLAISAIHDVQPAADGAAIIVMAQTRTGDTRSPLEIAITTELAAAVAISLLQTTARARRSRDSMEPALECFAVGVEDSSRHRDRVRLQLLFDGGTVLPVEIGRDAGEALAGELADWLANTAPDARVGTRDGAEPLAEQN
jgi:hypothetical protein